MLPSMGEPRLRSCRPRGPNALTPVNDYLCNTLVVAAVAQHDQAAVVQQQLGLALHFFLEFGRLFDSILRGKVGVAMQLDDQRAPVRWPDEPCQRLVPDHQRAGLGEQVHGVGQQVVEIGRHDQVEADAGRCNQRCQDGVTKSRELAFAQALDFLLAIVFVGKAPLHHRPVDHAGVAGIVAGEFLLDPGLAVLAFRSGELL